MMRKNWMIGLLVGLAGLLLAVWPFAGSLYDLTGEEKLVGQVAGMAHWLNTAARPQPRLAIKSDIPLAAVSPFGMNTFLQEEVEPEKREESLHLLYRAGFHWIRQEFVWEDIEIHGKGDFVDRRNVEAIGVVDAWAKYDNIVDLAEQYDIEIIARLSNPPNWSRALPPEEIGDKAPPDNFADFGDFAAAVAQRYRGRITYFQVWNEPNGNEEWGLRDVDPEGFTELLCTGYRRIKEANPDAVVLAGALTPTVANDGRHMNDLIFLQRMYNAGAGDCFDVMSAQGYGLFSGAADQRLRPNVINYPHHLYIRDLMVRNGDAHKPIWISEMGWNTAPEPLPETYGRATPEQQARYSVEAYQRARTDWPWLGVVNAWFFKRPADWEKEQPWYYFRLLEPDFTPTPAFTALAAYAADPSAVEPMPGWMFRWNGIRPYLFALALSPFFFSLLRLLAPDEQ